MNTIKNREIQFCHLHTINYKEALDYQLNLFDEIVRIKIANRQLPPDEQHLTPNYLLFCQHPHVYTLGKSGKETNLLVDENKLLQLQASYYPVNRGGDVTYHGPGQIVVYPIFDLENFFTDIHKYLRLLEESVILTLADYGLRTERISGLTGVWIDALVPFQARKIAAIGVKTSRWVTMHGLAFNINTDLSYFNHIIPCGITDKAVTSLQAELGKELNIKQVENKLLRNLSSLFEATLTYTDSDLAKSF